jgi:hypothetical protein
VRRQKIQVEVFHAEAAEGHHAESAEERGGLERGHHAESAEERGGLEEGHHAEVAEERGFRSLYSACFALCRYEHEDEPLVADFGVSSVERCAALCLCGEIPN